MEILRECKSCGIRAYTNYDLVYFQKRKEAKFGVNNLCKNCANMKGKSIKGKEYKEKYQIKKRYNCERADYYEKMSLYNECLICSSKENLCYDHCHTTDKFRGVLCRTCNAAIGQLGDTSERVLKAFLYLKEAEERIKKEVNNV